MRTWIVVAAMAALGLVLSACPKEDEKKGTKEETPKVEPK